MAQARYDTVEDAETVIEGEGYVRDVLAGRTAWVHPLAVPPREPVFVNPDGDKFVIVAGRSTKPCRKP